MPKSWIWRAALGVVGVLLLVLVLFFTVLRDGGDGEAQVRAEQSDGIANEAQEEEASDCPTGEGDWELQDLHGENGQVVNDGIEDADHIVRLMQKDPVLAHTFAVHFLGAVRAKSDDPDKILLAEMQVGGEIPSDKELRCEQVRRDLVNQVIGIILASDVSEQTLGELATKLGLPTSDGKVSVSNAHMDGDQVGTQTDTKPVDDKVLTIVMPNGGKMHVRKECGNRVIPEAAIPSGKGRIDVIKTDDGNNSSGIDLPVSGFRIIIDGPVHREGVTNGSGVARFNSIPPGTYTVREVAQAGWEAVTPDVVTVEVKEGQASTVRFKNRQVKVQPTTPSPRFTPPPGATNTPPPPGAIPTPTNTPRPPRPVPTDTPQPTHTPPPPCCPPPPTFEPPPPPVPATATPPGPIINPTPTPPPDTSPIATPKPIPSGATSTPVP
ncbi:carboxypeptidase regulatory-like domain-containing protein [Patescibacteria group bacterium]|nr:carboxypeptidase regulatory-like domain-containing protein [Patescibacteria group bacterium]